MATGILATLDITSASTDLQLYAGVASKNSSLTVCLTNRTSSPVNVNIALTQATSVSNPTYIAYQQIIYPNESYERSGLVITTGQYVYVNSSATGVSAVAWGYEE